ncbi:helix-turn-helix transcriptional regulator [Nitritalea halalkaliphila]|nr:WYL domain-containing protein [Nitritalea halalkaliphila]
MESDQGWSIPLERVKEGKRVYYRYADRAFTIKDQGINQAEAEQLKETLTILSRFKGMPQFEWIEEMHIRLTKVFHLKEDVGSIVGFEQNPFLKGLDHFTEIFNAIQHGVALDIVYQGFRQNTPTQVTLHPWYLKQFNNRWFLFGHNETYNAISNFALDRILQFTSAKVSYRENKQLDFDAYFEDVIGVTVRPDVEVETIQIRVDNALWPYIESKPLHGSQKVKHKSDTETRIEIAVQVNHELLALLFSYLDGLEVISPPSLRSKFKALAESITSKYL